MASPLHPLQTVPHIGSNRVVMAHGFLLQRPFKPWRDRIRHITWAWYTVIMGTGILSALCNNFPYGNGSAVLDWLGFAFFMLSLVLFIFISACTIARYVMFPEIWSLMIVHPAQSLFIACLPMGIVTLINAALSTNQIWGFGGTGFLYTLWAFWWLNALLSYSITFGMFYVMTIRHAHSLSKMTVVWLVPMVPLVVASSSGGLLAEALQSHSVTLALLTIGFSFTMLLIGLSFSFMTLTVYFLRLIIHGAPETALILTAFITLGPLGQGGYSLLINGRLLSQLMPLHVRGDFPFINQAGQMIYAACFIGCYVLWSMGIAWLLIALICVFSVTKKNKVPFSMSYWGMVFPMGTFALSSVQIATVLDSPFFRVFGAIYCIIVLLLWIVIFLKSIPAFIDGTLFKAPYVAAEHFHQPSLESEMEKGEQTTITTKSLTIANENPKDI